MATHNRGRDRERNGGRTGRNNNPQGRNQYSGMIGTARGNPLITAAALGGTLAAGVFLWSRRDRISDQISNIANQLIELRDAVGPQYRTSDGSFMAQSGSQARGDGRSQTEIAEEALTLKEISQAE